MILIVVLVAVLLFCALWWGVHRLAAAFGLPDQIVAIVDVVLVIVFIVVILAQVFTVPGLSGLRLTT